MSPVFGEAGRADDSDDLEFRIDGGRSYRVLATDVPLCLRGYPVLLYAGDPDSADPVGDIEGSASGRVLVGASRTGLGFVVTVPSTGPRPVSEAEWIVPRDHLRAHYNRHDGPVDVLAGGD